MKSWYSNSNDIEMKDGSKWKEYRVVFETDSKELKLRFGGLKHEFTLPILRNQGKCKDQNGVRSITTY